MGGRGRGKEKRKRRDSKRIVGNRNRMVICIVKKISAKGMVYFGRTAGVVEKSRG